MVWHARVACAELLTMVFQTSTLVVGGGFLLRYPGFGYHKLPMAWPCSVCGAGNIGSLDVYRGGWWRVSGSGSLSGLWIPQVNKFPDSRSGNRVVKKKPAGRRMRRGLRGRRSTFLGGTSSECRRLSTNTSTYGMAV